MPNRDRVTAIILAVCFALLLVVVSTAQADSVTAEQNARLNAVASVFAERPVSAFCPDRAMWNADGWAQGTWGYVLGAGIADQTELAPLMCQGAAEISNEAVPAWQRAVGALVLTHESYHLRRWAWNTNEGRVECQAIRHFKIAVRLLGGSRELADRLQPYALAFHWRISARHPEYYFAGCHVPNWYHL